MKAFCTFITAMVIYFKAATAASGDGVVSGYLVLNDDSKCLGTDGVNLGTPTSTSEADLAAACIKLYLVEGTSPQHYHILKLEDQTMKFKLTDGDPPAFVNDGSETYVRFSNGVFLECPIKSRITSKDNGFAIQLTGFHIHMRDYCLTSAPVYDENDCGFVQWYFIEAECTIPNCATCNVDATKCDSCADGTHVVNNEKTTCQDCKTAIEKCTTCSDSTGSTICSACADPKVPNKAGTACVDCNAVIGSCRTCSDSTGSVVCSACDDSKVPDSDGTACVECRDWETPNAEGTACVVTDSVSSTTVDLDDELTTTAGGSATFSYITVTNMLSLLLLKSFMCL